MRLKLSCRYM